MRKLGVMMVVVLVLALAGAASADVVLMQNGQTLQGTIKQHDNVRLIISIAGRDYAVASEQVLRIQYGDRDPAAGFTGNYGSSPAVPYYGVGEMYLGPRRVIVTAARANLQVGPGTEYSLLADVPRDSILVALGETAQWYRIILPDGSHAWLNKSLSRMIQLPTVRSQEYFNYSYGYTDYARFGALSPGYAVRPPDQPLPPEPAMPAGYRQAQLEQVAHQLRLTLTPAEVAELVKLLQR